MNKLVGILGGTFNPIHYGHLRMAQELADTLGLKEVRFIPSANPPHKTTPIVSAEHRAAMVKLAIADNALFKLDTRELKRSGASYTIDTLISLNEELGRDIDQNLTFCLLMGSDAFAKLNTWHRWQELLNYCHIVLVQRPSTLLNQPKLPNELTVLLHEHYTENVIDLTNKTAGYIHMHKITAQDISATSIRDNLKLGISPRYLTPNQVIEYIQRKNLYL